MFIIKVILFGLISKLICGDVDVDIVKRLKTRYNDTSIICLDSQNRMRPAYECSGILIRGVKFNKSKMKYPWSNRGPANQTNSFAYSFLRTDQLFSSMARGYDAGFIIYPRLKTPPTLEENIQKVFCAFPIDGYTEAREGNHGCGQYRDDKTGRSSDCEVQGINSLTKWISHFQNITNSKNNDFKHCLRQYNGTYYACFLCTSQCVFDMTTENAARAFQVVLAANIYIRKHSETYAYHHNELQIEAWNDENCKEIPIEAFFYIFDVPGADAKAASFRDAFHNCGGRKLPVLGIRLPTADRDLHIENF